MYLGPPIDDFIVKEAGTGVSYRAIPALQQRRWLADLSRQIRDLPDGTRVEFRTRP